MSGDVQEDSFHIERSPDQDIGGDLRILEFVDRFSQQPVGIFHSTGVTPIPREGETISLGEFSGETYDEATEERDGQEQPVYTVHSVSYTYSLFDVEVEELDTRLFTRCRIYVEPTD